MSDRDSSHTVEKHDFYVVIRVSFSHLPLPFWDTFPLQKVRDIYGAESAQMSYAKESLNALWDGLMQLADKNKDEVITLVSTIATSPNGRGQPTRNPSIPGRMDQRFEKHQRQDGLELVRQLHDLHVQVVRRLRYPLHPSWLFILHSSVLSADNVLDIAEYTDGMCAYGLSEKEAQEAFKRFAVVCDPSSW